MISHVYILRGSSAGKTGTIAGDFTKLSPNVKRVPVTIKGAKPPNDFKIMSVKSLRLAMSWEIEK
jgi:hypothetical protein